MDAVPLVAGEAVTTHHAAPGDCIVTLAGRCWVLPDGRISPPRTPEQLALLDERTALVGRGEIGDRVAEIDALLAGLETGDPVVDAARAVLTLAHGERIVAPVPHPGGPRIDLAEAVRALLLARSGA